LSWRRERWLTRQVDDLLGRYRTYGCPVIMACGEVVCRVAEGRSVSVLRKMDAADVGRLVGGVPEGKEHCPMLAVEAVARALAASAEGCSSS
jgi:NifU-like protein involved in Fe-S cluster formation